MIRLLRCIAYSMDTPQSRGKFGEMIVASIFDPRFFGEDERYLVNDVIFETPDGKTHQIDHILIYKKGIFCIETKNIYGVIVGHKDSFDWRVYENGANYEIMNPILQNRKHVEVLSDFLKNKYVINSIVVFIRGNKPKEVSSSEVLNLQDLKDYIRSFPCERELTSEEMKEVFGCLSDYKNDGVITPLEHALNVKAIKNRNK